MSAPWTWRIPHPDSPKLVDNGVFHAYDEASAAACNPLIVLAQTWEEPNEGSDLCPNCVTFVAAYPAGRS